MLSLEVEIPDKSSSVILKNLTWSRVSRFHIFPFARGTCYFDITYRQKVQFAINKSIIIAIIIIDIFVVTAIQVITVCVYVCVCVCLFPSTVEAFPDWNKTINVMPGIRPALLCWGNYFLSSTFIFTSYTIIVGTSKLATVQECQLNRAEPRDVKYNS